MERKVLQIPPLVRICIFSYCNLLSLLNTHSKLSRTDRKNLTSSENLDQSLKLKLDFEKLKNESKENIPNAKQISYSVKLCKQVKLLLKTFKTDIYIHDILRIASKYKKYVEIEIKIDENDSQSWERYFKDEYQSYLNQIKKVKFIYDRNNQSINMAQLIKPLENVTFIEVCDQREQKQAHGQCTFLTELEETVALRIQEFHYTS